MSMPGSDLSQPASSTEPSSRSANMTVSTESAMTSRDTSEARMPSWPMEMPKEPETVPTSRGYPPASCPPSWARLASRSSERLQGVISFQDDATPICGFSQSSSPMPTARSIARAGALVIPSVTSRLRGLTSTVSLLVGRSSTVVTIGDRRRRTDRPDSVPVDDVHQGLPGEDAAQLVDHRRRRPLAGLRDLAGGVRGEQQTG